VDNNLLTFSIISGNSSGAFAIDPTTGSISIAGSTLIDFEEVAQYLLTINVSDGVNEQQAIIIIQVENMNDNTPVVSTMTTAAIEENAQVGSSVTAIPATDPDGDNITFSIITGNDLGAFTINSTTGEITVSDPQKLDYETTSQFVLNVLVTDGVYSSVVSVIVHVSDKAELGIGSALTTSIVAASHSLAADGVSTTFITVQVKDINGNNTNLGVQSVTLATTLGQLSSITDLGNGVYQVTLTAPNNAGAAVISGTLNGTNIINTENVVFTVVPVILTATISADPATIPADGISTTSIVITITDQTGKLIKDAVLSAQTSLGHLGDVVNHGDGTYTIVLTSTTLPGEAVVTITVSGIAQTLTASIILEELPETPVFIPEGFSPDGDGVNDTFVIEGAEKYKVSFQVVNRWGNVVYEAASYKNDWDGFANQGLVIGQKLPDGTYFYIVDLNNQTKPAVRFFTIKRK
jgi:gliding motility-associated-like protein